MIGIIFCICSSKPHLSLRSIIVAGIFTCDGCARDPYFYVPAETQSYVIKLSCSRKVFAPVGFELGTFGLQQRSESDTLATAPAKHIGICEFCSYQMNLLSNWYASIKYKVPSTF